MRCQRCDKENPDGGAFCNFCGAPLEGTGTLEEQVQGVRRTLAALNDRLVALERSQDVRRPAVSPPQAPAAAIAPSPLPPPLPVSRPEGETSPQYAPAPLETPAPKDRSIDWEQILGFNWLAIVGAVALAVGIGFFLKLAFDNNWIGPTGRVLLGVGVGIALTVTGGFTQRRYPKWAQAATGGGVSILYLSIYAAFGFYRILAVLPAFLLLALVVAGAGAAALRYESMVIALMGIFGAFLTPALLGQDLPDKRLVMAYILLVDAGILGVSTFRNWRWFTLLGLLASYALFGRWMQGIPESWLFQAQGGLTGVFLIFVAATTLFHVLWRRKPNGADLGLMTLNAAAYFGATYGLLWEDYRAWFGAMALGLAVFYGLLGFAAGRRQGAPPEVALFSWATGLVYLTVAAPLQLIGAWITAAWAVEGAVLVWAGFLLGSWRTRAFGLGVLSIAAFRLLAHDSLLDTATFKLFLNGRFLTSLVAIIATYAAAWFYWKRQDRLEDWEENLALTLTGAANLLTLYALSAEIVAFFDHRALAQGASLDTGITKLLALSAFWSAYALAVLGVAFGTRIVQGRVAGLGLLALAALTLMATDTFALPRDLRGYTLVLNIHFLTLLFVLTAICAAAYLYLRQDKALQEWESPFLPGLLVAANVLFIWGMSAEVVRFFEARELAVHANLESAKHLCLTVLWALYAIAIIAVGIVRGSRAVRLAGLVLLVIPVAKLFAFDVFLLERGYRVAAFVILGVLLLGTGLAYQRYSAKVRRFLFGHT